MGLCGPARNIICIPPLMDDLDRSKLCKVIKSLNSAYKLYIFHQNEKTQIVKQLITHVNIIMKFCFH